jgi:hypothetical protein
MSIERLEERGLRIVATYTHDLWDIVSFKLDRYDCCRSIVVPGASSLRPSSKYLIH